MRWVRLRRRVAVLERRAGDRERRLDGIADAEHELRGALTAFGLALDRLGRDPLGRRIGVTLASELERARAALADLTAARHGEVAAPSLAPLSLDRLARSAAAAWRPAAREEGRCVQVDWRAGPVRVRADRGRLAQALGNLLSNAVEHGSGPIRLEAVRVGRRVRLEVLNGTGEPPAAPPAGEPPAAAPPVERARPPAAAPPAERGRGLRIAARAVEECGGTLSLTRADGRAAAALELPVGP
jgi:signal transduction histidine kinase